MSFRSLHILGKAPWRDAAVIASAYLLLAVNWIVWSDAAVKAIAGGDAGLLDRLQSYKGLFFVASTGGALFLGVAFVARTRARLIEEKLQMEQLINAQAKFEALGHLAGTLAHDFRNVLTVIQSAAALAEQGENPRGMIETIQRSAQHAERAIAGLMVFVRQQPGAFVEFDLGAQLREAEPLLRQALGRGVTLRTALPETPVRVHGVPALLTQAILNLATNARDALEGNPQPWCALSLGVRPLRGYRSIFRAEPADGPHAIVSFTDNGCGIAPEKLTAIFAPLFTTKPAGKGTGLGLSSALRAAQQHGGWIEVESEVGRGTTFRVFIPVVAE